MRPASGPGCRPQGALLPRKPAGVPGEEGGRHRLPVRLQPDHCLVSRWTCWHRLGGRGLDTRKVKLVSTVRLWCQWFNSQVAARLVAALRTAGLPKLSLCLNTLEGLIFVTASCRVTIIAIFILLVVLLVIKISFHDSNFGLV